VHRPRLIRRIARVEQLAQPWLGQQALKQPQDALTVPQHPHRQRGIELIGSGKGAAHGPIVIELGFDLPKDALAHIPALIVEGEAALGMALAFGPDEPPAIDQKLRRSANHNAAAELAAARFQHRVERVLDHGVALVEPLAASPDDLLVGNRISNCMVA